MNERNEKQRKIEVKEKHNGEKKTQQINLRQNIRDIEQR